MAYIKQKEEVEKIIEGGRKLGEILDKLVAMVKPGVSGWNIDEEAERMIKEIGGRPAFKGYRGKKNDPPFPSTICFSINEELVHGIATKEKIIKEGDIVTIDIGMVWPSIESGIKNKELGRGFYTDTAITVAVGGVGEKVKQLLSVTKKSLMLGIKSAVVGNSVADIGKTIEKYIDPQGYGIVRDLVGHGVGHAVHEEPRVPNYYDEELEQWELKPGVVIAIEPMITIGDYNVDTAEDGWGISTVDKSLCAHFEHTVVITEDGPVIATLRPSEMV